MPRGCSSLWVFLHLQAVSNRETEVQTEDEQAFLARQQEILKQGGQVRGESPLRSQGGSSGGNKSGPRTPGSTGQSSPKKVSTLTHTHTRTPCYTSLHLDYCRLILSSRPPPHLATREYWQISSTHCCIKRQADRQVGQRVLPHLVAA